MSRQNELLKLAQLFYVQASLTRDRAAKRSLRKMGDYYRHEAERLRGQAASDSNTAGRPSDKHSFRHRAA
jgi:hypothetical protein